MATKLEPRTIDRLGIYGLIRPAEVDDSVIPEGAVTESVNFHFDRKGAATVRPGVAALGSTVLASRPGVGLHNAQAGTPVVVFSNGSSSAIYSYSSGAWSISLDGGTASVKIRFVDFGSYTIAINFIYNTYSSMRFWNAGSSRHWHFTGNPLNVQNMWGYTPQLGEVFKNRVYFAGDTSKEGNTSRLFFSSVISSTGRITFSPLVDYVDINPGDGEGITALRRYSLELLAIKPNYIYRFRTNLTDPDPLIKIGTRSQESVIEGKRGLYLHHDSGFYRYTGGYPVEISRPISDIVQAIPFSQFGEISGWNDSDHIFWSVGNLTITEAGLSQTWRNIVLRLTESSDLWTVYSLAFDVRRAMTYISGSSQSRIAALDNGVVTTLDSGITDLGEPIEYWLRTKWYDWGSPSLMKIIEEISAICEKAQTMHIMYQVDEEQTWQTLGQLKKFSNFFRNLTIRFHRIRFRVIGTSRFESAVFLGLNILKGSVEGLVKEQ